MKTPAHLSLLRRSLAAFLLLTWAAIAQDQAATTATVEPVGSTGTVTAPAAAAPEAAPAAPAADAPSAPAAEPAPSEPELRRLDVPESAEAPVAPATDDQPKAARTEEKAVEASPDQPDAEAAPAADTDNAHKSRGNHRGHHTGDERVSFGSNSTLAAGDSAEAVVSIFGSSTSAGTVHQAVVSILGSSTSSGKVGDAVVSILGNSRVTDGSVGNAVVSILGTTYVNARVHGEVVAVLGNVELGPDAEISGDIVCVGGSVKRDPGAILHGKINHVAFGPAFDGFGGGMEWLQAWVTQCLVLLRPLAFGPHLMWAWWIALGFLGLYVLLAAVFPGAMGKCVTTLEERPGYSILAALFTMLLAPIVFILLCFLVVGIPVVPFLALALLIASLFGKAVMLTWIGRRITKHINNGAPLQAAISTLVGGVIVLLLYTVPVLGFILYKALGVLGLGVVVYTLIQGSKRKPAPPIGGSAAAASAVPPGNVPNPAPMSSAGFGSPTTDAVIAAIEPRPNFTAPPPVIEVSAVTLPRAGFWIRIAASLIDMLIVVVAVQLIPGPVRPNIFFAFAVYAVILWALKATTVGGIVCNLKVVRLDDRPMDWPTALVRALGGFLSLIAVGLGFIWVAFDDQKQSWHDKIAGTTIVQVPRGQSLV